MLPLPSVFCPKLCLQCHLHSANRRLMFLIGYMVDHIICFCCLFYPFYPITEPVDTGVLPLS